MRIAIAAIVAAGLMAAPATAQDTNQANATTPTNAVTEAPENAVGEPVLPVTDDTAVAPAMDPGFEPAPAPAPTRRDDGGFPWGLIGLIGLVGLLGRSRG